MSNSVSVISTERSLAEVHQKEQKLVVRNELNSQEQLQQIEVVTNTLVEYQENIQKYLQNQESQYKILHSVMINTPQKLRDTETGQKLLTCLKHLLNTNQTMILLQSENEIINSRIQQYLTQIVNQLCELFRSNRIITSEILDDFKDELDQIEMLKKQFLQSIHQNLEPIQNNEFVISINNQYQNIQSITSGITYLKTGNKIEQDNIQFLEDKLIKEQSINEIKAKLDSEQNILKIYQNQLKNSKIELNLEQNQHERIQKEKQDELNRRKSKNQVNQDEKIMRKEVQQKQLMEYISQKNMLILEMSYEEEKQRKRLSSQNKIFNEIIMGSNASQSTYFRIFVLDESGSMDGTAFNEAINAVRNMITDLKADRKCDDSFCLIQFGTKARTLVKRTQIKSYNVNKLPNDFGNGNTNFEQAFKNTKIELEESRQFDRPQIIFLTDGGDSNDKYRIVLREITNSFKSRHLSMFCIGCGAFDTYQLKVCLKIVNGNDQYLKLSNGEQVQTLFSVKDVRELTKVFSQIRQSAPFDLTQITQKKEILLSINQEYEEQINKKFKKQLQIIEAQIKILQDENKELIEEKDLHPVDIENNINIIYEELLRQTMSNKEEIETQIQNLSQKISKQNAIIVSLEQQINTEMNKLECYNMKKPETSAAEYQQHQQDIKNNLQQFGFLSLEQFKNYKKEIKKSRQANTDCINTLKFIRETSLGAHSFIKQMKMAISNYQIQSEQYQPPNLYNLIMNFRKVLQIEQNLDPQDLVILVISEVIPSFKNKVESLQNPIFFKEKVLAPLLTNEMWPQVQQLVFFKIKGSSQKKDQTFDEYSQNLLLQLYGISSEEMNKQTKIIASMKKTINKIDEKITEKKNNMDERKQNFEKELEPSIKKIQMQFDQKIKYAGDDSEKVEKLEEDKELKLENLREKEENKLEQDMDNYDRDIFNLEQEKEQASLKQEEATDDYEIAKEKLINNFSKEFDLIKVALKNIRIAADRMEIVFKEYSTKLPLMKIINATQKSYEFLQPIKQCTLKQVEQQQ